MKNARIFDSFPAPFEQVRQYTLENSRSVEVKGHPVARALVFLLVRFFRWLSWPGAWRLGSFLGHLACMLQVRKKIAMTNLDLVYGDKKTKQEKEQIYQDSMINIGRYVLNLVRLPAQSREFWESHFRIVNEDLAKEVYNRGKGVILTGGHIGMWEIAAGRLGMAGYPIAIIAKRVANPVVDKMVVDLRNEMNLGTIRHRDSMDRVRRGIEEGEGVIMAIDQNMKRSQGVFVDWMGHIASTVRSNAWVARETGATVIVGYAIQLGPSEFEVRLTEEIPWVFHPEDPEQELLINTQNQADAVARVIFEHPEQWMWIHRRFKVQPDEQDNPYR